MVEKCWSIDLEHDEYESNQAMIIEDGIKAVEETDIGYYVNLVTSANFGNPDLYLTPHLKKRFDNRIQAKFINQCGCGGYVLRVWKLL